tara:strand:+ start:1071 stop:2942 length:1872 start_codon:yes stop_codon:yes gene_type:complete
MAIKSSQLNITDLDFDDISVNLRNYLKGQDQFKDYDFDGSNMSVLIDLLSYASHIGAVNTNIAASELFLDSAQIRKNVVSRAKDLGFIPQSETGSTAIVDITLSDVRNPDGTYPTTTEMTLSRGSIFNTTFDGKTYSFVCPTTIKPTQNGDSYIYNQVNLVQGIYASDTFVYDSQLPNPKFVLTNNRVDKSRIQVSVNSNGVSTTYALSTNISTITTESTVFYEQENEDGFREIYFGDGVLGKQLLDGDIITMTYIIVDKNHANGARTFSMLNNINGFSNTTITASSFAQGGAEKESIDSIKFKANKFYTSQNRLVTLNDYKAKVSEYYPNADAVAVWGGEDNNPPEYGKIFVALKPKNSDYLSDTEKSNVVKKLNALNMLTVRPTIVDPEIIKILISTSFKYNPNATSLSEGELETVVTNAINTFDNQNLSNFDSIFRHSNLIKDIDNSNDSILSNTTNIRLKKSQKVFTDTTRGVVVEFGNGLYNPHVGHAKASGGILSTTGFKVSGDSVNTQYFDDDGNGNLRRYYLSGSTRIYQDSSAGTVDYATGKVSIGAIFFTSVVNVDSTIDFTVIPNSLDVVATRGNLVDIDQQSIVVKGEIDTIASGESSAGVGYTSTSSSSY